MQSIIQFIHPGVEHTCKTGKVWNTSSHRRKYLSVKGTYLKDLESKPVNNQLYFWGEWEAQSNCVEIKGNNSPEPTRIFEPHYELPMPVDAANTDPFVFGKQFYYCICKQGHYPSLRELKPKDIILFGSNKNWQFVIDTVFVVKRAIPYSVSEINRLKTSFNETFFDVSLLPILKSEKVGCKNVKDFEGCIYESDTGDDVEDNYPTDDKEYMIYEAVMYKERYQFDGMFSYAPCLAEPEGKMGFQRPVINLPDISSNLNQGIKIIKENKVQDVWNAITQQVLNSKLNLMIETDLPLKQ